MDQEGFRKNDVKETISVCGYLHSVSLVKVSKRNKRYFTAVFQIERQQYRNTVVFSLEKYGQMLMAARNKTAVKVLNAREKISLTDKVFDVMISHDSRIDDTNVSFSYNPPEECAATSIADIRTMPPQQKISILNAAVYSVSPASNTVNTRGKDLECRTCCLADATSSIDLTLWNKHIEMVENKKSYSFQNLTTRKYHGNLSLTTTRETIISALSNPVACIEVNKSVSYNVDVNRLNLPVEGAAIRVQRLCPKCKTPQNDFCTREKLHRCQSCKIIRRVSSYIMTCNGTVTFMLEDEELCLSINNSQLSRFLKSQGKCGVMDFQDIEAFLLTVGSVTVEYTAEKQITNLSKGFEAEQQEDHRNEGVVEGGSDKELCGLSSDPMPKQQSISQRAQKRTIMLECAVPEESSVQRNKVQRKNVAATKNNKKQQQKQQAKKEKTSSLSSANAVVDAIDFDVSLEI